MGHNWQSAAAAQNFIMYSVRKNHWTDFHSGAFGPSTDWVSGYIGYLVSDSELTGTLGDVCSWLLARQKGGGWGWGLEKVDYPCDADSTACCGLFLNAQGYLDDSQRRKIIDFLFRHQRHDGGFATFESADIFVHLRSLMPGVTRFDGWCSSHVSVTAMAIQCLVALGVSLDDERLECALDYLAALPVGLYEDYWWRDPFYSTYHVVIALVQGNRFSPTAKQEIDLAVSQRQNSRGYWECDGKPCAFATASALNTLALVGGNQNALAAGLSWLESTQLVDGSWAGAPILQIPDPSEVKINRDSISNIHSDKSRLFTTSTVYAALGAVSKALGKGPTQLARAG